jgi:hypothetical protein
MLRLPSPSAATLTLLGAPALSGVHVQAAGTAALVVDAADAEAAAAGLLLLAPELAHVERLADWRLLAAQLLP